MQSARDPKDSGDRVEAHGGPAPRPGSKPLGCDRCASRLDGIFGCLENGDLGRLNAAKVSHTYERGHVLFYEGNAANSLYCLRSGVVKVFKAGSRGRHHVLYLARAGDVLGLESLLTGDRHTATAEVLEPGTVCQLDRAELSRLIDDRPELLREIARSMARQLESCGTERTGLASAPVRERLALTLVSLGSKFGDAQGDSVRIGVDLSREELAEIVGASTETVIRQLSEFRDKGILSTDGRSIVLQDTDRLARIARLPTNDI